VSAISARIEPRARSLTYPSSTAPSEKTIVKSAASSYTPSAIAPATATTSRVEIVSRRERSARQALFAGSIPPTAIAAK
jgi:hypothetical protein